MGKQDNSQVKVATLGIQAHRDLDHTRKTDLPMAKQQLAYTITINIERCRYMRN
jgi:hypothetical protein